MTGFHAGKQKTQGLRESGSTLSVARGYQGQPGILQKAPRDSLGNNEDNWEDLTLLCFPDYSLGYFWKDFYEKLPHTQLFSGNNRQLRMEATFKCPHFSSSPHQPFCPARLLQAKKLQRHFLPSLALLVWPASHTTVLAWSQSTMYKWKKMY